MISTREGAAVAREGPLFRSRMALLPHTTDLLYAGNLKPSCGISVLEVSKECDMAKEERNGEKGDRLTLAGSVGGSSSVAARKPRLWLQKQP